jgi:TonB family protein
MLVSWEESGILSLFRSPFLIPSLVVHCLLFVLAVRAGRLTSATPQSVRPISVQLLEVREGASANRSIGSNIGPGGPRTAPKLGIVNPVQRSGKVNSGSLESSGPTAQPEAAPESKAPILPGPKTLVSEARDAAIAAKETSPDSLVRLPTQESSSNLPPSAAADLDLNRQNLAALKAMGEGPGIKAVREGAQIPGALKGTGTGVGTSGVPGGSRTGTGTSGNGTGTGVGGGSNSGLKGVSSADYNQYLKQLEKRVNSVWKYPDDVAGVQKVAVRFTLDKAGKLLQADVLESSDARLNASAVEAMKRASPFPPIPDNLKDLANEPLIIRFTVSIRVRS